MVGQRQALIVANDEYDQESLRNLTAAAADAEALGRVLGDPEIGGFRVQVARNKPAHDIQAQIEELFTESRADDVLLLHFSCHGLKSQSGELFFAAANTRPDRLGSTAVSADFVQRCMRSSRSRSVVLLLDCCYGGAFARGVTVRASGDVNVLDSFPGDRSGGGRGRAVITASSAMEYAFEGDQLTDDHRGRPSVFTGALVDGLATGEADRDEDGWISLNELYDYVFDKVRERNPHQTPSRHIELAGDLYLARSPRRRIHPAPIPRELRTAMTDQNMYTRLGAVSELRARLASDDLPAAAGARDALAELARTAIQHVASPAAAALREAAVQPGQTELHFGQIEQGSAPPHRTVQLLGPPIARACVSRPSHDWIRVGPAAEGLDISIDTTRTGTLRGSLGLKGPTGEAAITIEVDLICPTPRKYRFRDRARSADQFSPPAPRAAEPARSAPAPQTSEPSPGTTRVASDSRVQTPGLPLHRPEAVPASDRLPAHRSSTSVPPGAGGPIPVADMSLRLEGQPDSDTPASPGTACVPAETIVAVTPGRADPDPGNGPDAKPARAPRGRRIRPAALAGALVLILGVTLAAAILKNSPNHGTQTLPGQNYAVARTLHDPIPGTDGAFSVAYSPNGKTLATGDWDGSAYLWDIATGNLTATLTVPSTGKTHVRSVTFSPDSKTLAVGASNGRVYLWNVTTRKLAATLSPPGMATYSVQAVAFSPDGAALAVGGGSPDGSGSFSGRTYLWDVPTRRLTTALTDPGEGARSVESVAFDPDGLTLVTGDYNGLAYLWDVSTGKVTGTLASRSVGRNPVWSVAFSPDGATVAVARNDGSTSLWNIATGALTATLNHPGTGLRSANSVAFSSDGKTLATGGVDGSTYLWDIATQHLSGTLPSPGPGSVMSVAFSPDSQTLATGDSNGSTYLWKPGRP